MSRGDRRALRIARALAIGASGIALAQIWSVVVMRLAGREEGLNTALLSPAVLVLPLGVSLFVGLGVVERALTERAEAAPATSSWRPPPLLPSIGVVLLLFLTLAAAYIAPVFGGMFIVAALFQLAWMRRSEETISPSWAARSPF